jgi:predicted dehydrogenase
MLFPNANIGILRLTANRVDGSIDGANAFFSNMEEAIAFAPDAAIIASPASTHEKVACALASHGVHLLIEKPLACNCAAAQKIIDACEAAQVICMIGYNLRYKRSMVYLRELLLKGIIGNVLSVRAEVGQHLSTWRPEQDYRYGVSARRELGGGALLELSHELDYIVWLFGMPDTVQCAMGHYSDLEIEVEDLVELTLLYSRPRRMVSVHLDFIQQTPTRTCKLIGTKGTIIWDALADTIAIFGTTAASDVRTIGPFDEDPNEPYCDEIRHFVQTVASGDATREPSIKNLQVMALVDAAIAAAERGVAVKMEQKFHG